MPHLTPHDHDTLVDRLPEHGERWGAYVLEERIASGGMADVFRARRVGAASFSRQVCIKRMHAHLGADPDMVALFLDEAQIGSKLRQRNIVAVEDLGEHEGRYYLAMEFVNGVDLRRIEKRAIELQSPVPAEAAAYLANELLAGLHAAHTALDPDTHTPMRVVHRDVSPQNVLVAFSGQVKLADFGVARAEGRHRVTESRLVCGKLGYMPLEQVTGSPVDARADLFALGVTLFELLTGLRPFTGDRSHCTRDEVVAAMLLGERPSLRALRPDVSPALAAVVDALLEVSPRRRLPSALAGLEMIEAATERTRGGRVLIEWLAAMYPGQASVAGIARAAIVVPPPLPTPRPAQSAKHERDTRLDLTPRIDDRPVLQLVDEVTRRARVERPSAPEQLPVTVRRGRLWVVPPAPSPSDSPPSARSGPQTVVTVEREAPRAGQGPTRTRVLLSRLFALACLAFAAMMVGALRSSRIRSTQTTTGVERGAHSARPAAPAVATQSPGASPAPPRLVAPAMSIRPDAAAAPAATLSATPTAPAPAPVRAARAHDRAPRVARAMRFVPTASPWPTAMFVASPSPAPPPSTGSLRVVVIPWGDVEIDGRAYGRAPVTASLPVGSHRVHVGGGLSRTQQVEVRQGQVSVLAFDGE